VCSSDLACKTAWREIKTHRCCCSLAIYVKRWQISKEMNRLCADFFLYQCFSKQSDQYCLRERGSSMEAKAKAHTNITLIKYMGKRNDAIIISTIKRLYDTIFVLTMQIYII